MFRFIQDQEEIENLSLIHNVQLLNMAMLISVIKMFLCDDDGGGATRPIPRFGGAKEFCGHPIVEPRPKVWTSDQR